VDVKYVVGALVCPGEGASVGDGVLDGATVGSKEGIAVGDGEFDGEVVWVGEGVMRSVMLTSSIATSPE